MFDRQLHAWWDGIIGNAVRDVQRLDRKALSDPALAGRLDAIAQKHASEVPRIDRNAIQADAREEEYRINDYGRSYVGKRKVLDVRIPFSGDPIWLNLSPSSGAWITKRLSVRGNEIVFTISDDANSEREVNTLADQITQNLDSLRRDHDQLKPQLREAIQQAASGRSAEMAADAERDKNRTFKVNR